jgi:hypothetical protein
MSRSERLGVRYVQCRGQPADFMIAEDSGGAPTPKIVRDHEATQVIRG